MRRIALIANEKAGSSTSRADLVRQLRELGADVTCFGVGEVDAAAGSGPDRLVAAGGDGTIGAAAGAAAAAGIPLAVIATGTANDFARGLAVPDDLHAACRLAVEGTNERRLELGRMDGRPFINAANTGLAAEAAERAKKWKPKLGPLAYLLGALTAGATSDPVRCSVIADGREVFEGDAWQVIVAVSGRFGAGASLDAVDHDDGLLDVAVLQAGGRARLIRYGLKLRSGAIAADRDVPHTRASEIRVEVPAEEPYNVDGEILRHGPATFTVEKDAFAVIVP